MVISQTTRYPGTKSFLDEDLSRAVFCGREYEIAKLTNKIFANRLVVIYAASGAGKTSLLQAGISQPLRNENYLPIIIRKYDFKETIVDCVYDGIHHAIDQAKSPHNTNFDPGGQISLWHLFKTAMSKDKLHLTPVLILDQFEEIFKLHNVNERSRFFAELGCLVRGIRPEHSSSSAFGVTDDLKSEEGLTDQPPVARVVISLREDYFGALAEAYNYIPQIYHNIFRLLPLKQEDARSAIVTPASIYLSGFDTKPFEFKSDAIDKLLNLLSENSNSGNIDPFQLQLQCQYIENWVKEEQIEGKQDVVVENIPGKKAIADYYKNTIRHASAMPDCNKSEKEISLSIERVLISKKNPSSRESVRPDMVVFEIGENVTKYLLQNRLIHEERYREWVRYELTHDLWMQTIQEYNKQFEIVDHRRMLTKFYEESENWLNGGKDGDILADRLLLDNQLIEAYKFAESRQDLGIEQREFIVACNDAINRIIRDAALGRANTIASQAMNQDYKRRCRMLLAVEAFRIAEKWTSENLKIDNRFLVNKALWEAFRSLASHVPFPKGQCLREHSAPVSGVAIVYGNHRMVSVDEEGTVLLWCLPDLGRIDKQELGHAVSAMAISRDSDCLVIGCKDGSTYLFGNLNSSNLNERKELKRHRSAVKFVGIVKNDKQNEYQWLITTDEDGTVYKYKCNLKDNPDCDHPVNDWKAHEKGIVSVAVSREKNWLFTAGRNETMTVHGYDLNSDQETLTFSYNAEIRVMAATRNNHWLVTGTDDEKVKLSDLEIKNSQNTPPSDLNGHKGLACAAAISPDDRWLVIGTDEGTVRLWDLHEMDKIEGNRKPVQVWDNIKVGIRTIEVTEDNQWFAVGSVDGRVRLFDLQDPDAKPLLLHPSQGEIRAMAMSSDSKWLVTGSADGSVLIWDLMKPFIRYPIPLNISAGNVRAITVGKNAPWLAIGSADGKIQFWEIKTLGYGELLSNTIPDSKPPFSHEANRNFNILAFSHNDRWLVSCGNCSDTPILLDMNAADPGQCSFPLKGHSGLVRAAAFSRDGRWLVTAGDDKTARLWDLTEPDPRLNSMELSGQYGHGESIWAVAISDNNKWLVTTGDDGTARLWELPPPSRTPDPKLCLNPMSWGIRAAAFSPNNKWLAVGNFWDGFVRIWDMNNLNFSQPDPEQQSPATYILTGHLSKQNFNIIVFSPDSRWLVTCENNLTDDRDGNRGLNYDQAFLWDMKDPAKRNFKLTGHIGAIRSAVFSSFSPSSKEHWLVTVGDDTIVHLWDLNASDPSLTAVELLGHKEPIRAAAITPDDHWLITGGDDGQVFLWSLRPKELIKLGELIVGRNLTRDEAQRDLQKQREQKTYDNLPEDPYTLVSIKGWIDCQDEN